jgi:hypothetical protein
MSGFSVVAMMRETPDVVQRFVSYYRKLGAEQIFIYHNGPAEEFPQVSGIDLTICTADFWARHVDGPMTDSLDDRQRICYRDCYTRCTSDWLLVVDADEFVFGDRPLAPLLARLPASVEAVTFPTAEAVFGPGDRIEDAFACTHFRTGWGRRRLWRLFAPLVYGRSAAVMNGGVMGHLKGKHMLRTGLDVTAIGGHGSRRGDTVIGMPAAKALPEFAGFYLAHFDALSLPRWEAKWRYRIDRVVLTPYMSRGRRRQMEEITKALAAGRGAALFRRFYGLGPVQYRILAASGTAFRRTNLFDDDAELIDDDAELIDDDAELAA